MRLVEVNGFVARACIHDANKLCANTTYNSANGEYIFICIDFIKWIACKYLIILIAFTSSFVCNACSQPFSSHQTNWLVIHHIIDSISTTHFPLIFGQTFFPLPRPPHVCRYMYVVHHIYIFSLFTLCIFQLSIESIIIEFCVAWIFVFTSSYYVCVCTRCIPYQRSPCHGRRRKFYLFIEPFCVAKSRRRITHIYRHLLTYAYKQYRWPLDMLCCVYMCVFGVQCSL